MDLQCEATKALCSSSIEEGSYRYTVKEGAAPWNHVVLAHGIWCIPVDTKEPFTTVDFSVISGFDMTCVSQEYKWHAERGGNGRLKYSMEKVKRVKHSEIIQLLHYFKTDAYVFLYIWNLVCGEWMILWLHVRNFIIVLRRLWLDFTFNRLGKELILERILIYIAF